MFGIILSPAIRWAAGILLVLTTIFGIYYKGRLDEREISNRYKAEVKAVAMAQEHRVEQLKIIQSQITKKAEVTREKSTASIRSTYSAFRMRNAASGGPVPKIPDAAADPDGAANYYISVAPELAEQCAQTTQQLIELQDWIQDQSELK